MKNCKKLFTPGPLNTSVSVKNSMNQDVGSRTQSLINITKDIRRGLENIAQCGTEYTSILLQGSGTFAIEAMLTTLINPNDKVLIASNGVYGERMGKICGIYDIPYLLLQSDPLYPIDIESIKKILLEDKAITHIAAVQFETGIGVLNDLNALIALASSFGCKVLVDAMSSFGVLPLNYSLPSLIAVASSANKCLHSVPGVGFVLVRKDSFRKSRKKRTLSLDLQEQWLEFEKSGEWRFTPPTHVLLALKEAIYEFQQNGGQPARLEKYKHMADYLVSGLAEIEIFPIVEAGYRAPIITTFITNNNLVDIKDLYTHLYNQGLVIYPSSFLKQKSFRIGCIGEITIQDISNLINAIKNYMYDLVLKVH